MAGKAFIFLNGFYQSDDKSLIRKILRQTKPRPLLLAVDGGLSFMQKISLPPDYWLTDLDSAPRIKKDFLKNTQKLVFPAGKDKTDGQLALEFCLKRKIHDLTFFGWYDRRNETDHLLGNLFLFHTIKKKAPQTRIRFIDCRQEIYPVKNQSLNLNGCKGRRLSIVPTDRSITLSLKGTAYPAKNLRLTKGHTMPLRNRITAIRAKVEIKGSALVVIGDYGQ